MAATDATGRRARAAHLGPERRRPMVLDAALHLFVERGYAGTSMDAIAAAAQVSKPVVYECYPNKQELFAALLEREESRLLDQVAAALPHHLDPADLGAMLDMSFTAFLRAVVAAPDSWRVVFASDYGGEPAVARRVERGRRAYTERLRALTRAQLEAWAVTDADRLSDLLARLIVAIGEAGARLVLASPDRWTPEELGAVLAGVVERGGAALR